MKVSLIAGTALVLVLAGCAQPTSGTDGKSGSNTGMQSPYASANYYSNTFGDTNNSPFAGTTDSSR